MCVGHHHAVSLAHEGLNLLNYLKPKRKKPSQNAIKRLLGVEMQLGILTVLGLETP